MNKKYILHNHLKYQIESEKGLRMFIIPMVSGIPDMKKVLCLADTSLEIWNLISNNYSSSEIINILCEKYDQEEPAISNDVTAFLNKLIETGFISSSM